MDLSGLRRHAPQSLTGRREAAVLAPVAVAGILLGVRLHARVDQELFYRLCYGFLFVTGLKLAYDGLAVVPGL